MSVDTPAGPSSTAMLAKIDQAAAGLQESFDVATVVPRQAIREARQATDRRARFWLPLVIVAAIGAAFLTAAAMYFYFGPQIDQLRLDQAATSAAATEVARVAMEAREQAAAANAELEERGQATVPVPQVGEATDAEVLVSAATARVLASLPDAQPVTAGAIAAAVRDYAARNPVTPVSPTTGQIADAVAAYLQANPPPAGNPGATGQQGATGPAGESIVGPRGDQGPMGEPGRPPTGEEIRAELDAYFVDNPIPPCPDGTSLQEVRFGALGPSGLACVFDGG